MQLKLVNALEEPFFGIEQLSTDFVQRMFADVLHSASTVLQVQEIKQAVWLRRHDLCIPTSCRPLMPLLLVAFFAAFSVASLT